MDEKLPYLTQPLVFPNGRTVEEFIIPDEDKEIVLEQIYPFRPVPKLTDRMIDIHVDKEFLVKDFRVTWEYGMNYLVSPYYPEGGGTVIDWWDVNDESDDEFPEDEWLDENEEDDDFSFDDLDDTNPF
jgi:hypothetical protein